MAGRVLRWVKRQRQYVLSSHETADRLAGVLPDAQGKKCRERLFKQIQKELKSTGAQP